MYTPSNITNPDSIHKELGEIQLFLESPYSADLSDQVQSRFDSLGAYMSSIMDCLKKGYEEKLSASTINKFVEAAARNYKFLFTWADRVNRSCTHLHEGMRSVMSTLRSERFANNYGR